MAKRMFDVIVSLLVMIVALPLWLVIGLAIKLDSPGPVLYRAIRIGKDGKPFTLYKFRSIVASASRWGPGITRDGHPLSPAATNGRRHANTVLDKGGSINRDRRLAVPRINLTRYRADTAKAAPALVQASLRRQALTPGRAPK